MTQIYASFLQKGLQSQNGVIANEYVFKCSSSLKAVFTAEDFKIFVIIHSILNPLWKVRLSLLHWLPHQQLLENKIFCDLRKKIHPNY